MMWEQLKHGALNLNIIKIHIYSNLVQCSCDSSKNFDLKQILTLNTADPSEKAN